VKINVIGTSGSGKSTLAKQIATELAIPYIEMDRLYWRPDWQGTPDDVFRKSWSRRYRLRQTGCLTATITARDR
jgi:adenylate kinase family enzyme